MSTKPVCFDKTFWQNERASTDCKLQDFFLYNMKPKTNPNVGMSKSYL